MKLKFNKYQRKEIAKFLKLVHGKERVKLFDLFSALMFLIHSSCKWKQLPSYYPHYWIVYYHFRHWSDTGLLDKFLSRVVLNRRKAKGLQLRTISVGRQINGYIGLYRLCVSIMTIQFITLNKKTDTDRRSGENFHRLCHPLASFDLLLGYIASYAPSSLNQNLLKGCQPCS